MRCSAHAKQQRFVRLVSLLPVKRHAGLRVQQRVDRCSRPAAGEREQIVTAEGGFMRSWRYIDAEPSIQLGMNGWNQELSATCCDLRYPVIERRLARVSFGEYRNTPG